MSPTVTITVADGIMAEKQIVFDTPRYCTVGRSSECDVQIPGDAFHRNVSRLHCVLNVAPPEITVRDLGSRNGTFVNGIKIGQRSSAQHAEDRVPSDMPEYRLYDGDEIQFGGMSLRVSVTGPAVCSACGRDISDNDKDAARVRRGEYLCDWCHAQQPVYHADELANSN